MILKESIISKYQEVFGEKLNDKQKEGLLFLLEQLSFRQLIKSQISYILATIKHETANTYQPIEEFGKGKGKKYGEIDPETGKAYYGRGYIQLTWKDNYRRMERRTGYPLVNYPEMMLQPYISFEVTLVGMLEGLFTGLRLDTFVRLGHVDFKNARKVVNGLDRAELIKEYAEKFMECLND